MCHEDYNHTNYTKSDKLEEVVSIPVSLARSVREGIS